MADELKTTMSVFYLGGKIRHIPVRDDADTISFITHEDDMFRLFKRHHERLGEWQLREERPATKEELDKAIWLKASLRNSPHADEN